MSSSGRVTMKDVAKLANVSVRTVSNVVNNYEFVSDEKRLRVKKAIRKLGYVINASARNLRRGRTGNIILAVPDLTMPYFADLTDQIIIQAHRKNLNVLVEPTLADSDEEGNALQRIHSNVADGIIYCPVSPEQQVLVKLRLRIPVVVLSEPTIRDNFDHVSIDNKGGAQAATTHLISRGCRRIAAIGLRGMNSPHDKTAKKRLEGYRLALQKADLSIIPSLEKVTNAWHRSDGALAIHDLMVNKVSFDGVFAFTDQIAAGVLYELRSWGLKVPENVAVIGFDNNRESKFFIPSLTTIDPGIAVIAKKAVSILSARIEEEQDSNKQKLNKSLNITVPFSLIKRESA